jgi:hypothetical protein
MRFEALRPLGLRNGQVIPLRAPASPGNIPTPLLRHSLTALQLLRKVLIRAAKPLKLPHRGIHTAGTLCAIILPTLFATGAIRGG